MNNNFRGSRHKTVGIENEVSELLQGIMWGLIDHNISKGLEMDYLQVFKLEVIKKDGIQTQKITHSQEVPERKFETMIDGAEFEPVSAKIFVISENDYAVMMLGEEY